MIMNRNAKGDAGLCLEIRTPALDESRNAGRSCSGRHLRDEVNVEGIDDSCHLVGKGNSVAAREE